MTRKAERWKVAEQRRHARERVRAARAALRAARAEKARRVRELRAECRAARAAARDRARELRREMIDRHQRERLELRALIAETRAALRRCSLEERERLERAIADARSRLATATADLAWLRRRKVVRGLRGMSPSEAREHERDTTRAELAHEWERDLFDRLYASGRIRSSERRSLGEAFAEWMHDHSADVWAAREAHAAEQLAQLEREEREASRAVRRRRPSYAASVDASPTLDEWGA